MARSSVRSGDAPQRQRPSGRAPQAAPDARAQVVALQRSAGNAATVRMLARRSWIRELLFPSPSPPDPDPAPRLKGEEREAAREANAKLFWQDPATAAEALDKLADTVYHLVITFWGNPIPSVSGLIEEIEDAFTGPAMSERSGPARDYARYIRARRSAAHAIFHVHLNKELSSEALKQVWIASDAPVPEAPPPEPSLEDDLVAYPGTERDHRRREQDLYARLEAMRQLRIDTGGGGQKRERLVVRARELYDFLAVEFSHGPLPDKSNNAGGAYGDYLEARIAVAKYSLDYGVPIPPNARKQIERQAAAAKQPYLEYGKKQWGDSKWARIERAAWDAADPAVRSEASGFDADMTALLFKIDRARAAVRERRATTMVSADLAKTVQTEAREVFGKPPRAISKPSAVLRRFLQKYLIFRHEYARLVTIAKLVPPEVAKPLADEANAKLTAVRALDDPDATDKAERDQRMPGNYSELIDIDIASPEWQEWFEVNLRGESLEWTIDVTRGVVKEGRRRGEEPFWGKTIRDHARREFTTRPPTVTFSHPQMTAALERYKANRHKLAQLLIKAQLVPDDIRTLVEQEAGVSPAKPKAAPKANLSRSPSDLQLETPWLLGGPRRRYPRLLDKRLELDPELIAGFLSRELEPERLLQYLGQVDLSGRTAQRPPPAPRETPGFETPAQPAGAGTFLGAVRAVPEVRRALDNVEHEVWGRLSSGDRTTLVTTSITFGAGALGGMLATPGGRAMLGQLSGVALPVPKVPWLSFEFSSRRNLVGFGVHVDLGALLPARLGFGAAGPRDDSPSLYPDPTQPRR